MIDGHIHLARKILESDLCPKGKFSRFEAWIYLLLNANGIAKKWQGILIDRGTLPTYQVRLAAEWKWSIGNVNKFLKYLKSENRIEIRPTNRFTLIDIVNYDKFNPLNESKNENKVKTNENLSENKVKLHNKDNKDNKEISTIVDNYIEFKETWKNIFGKYPTGGAIKVDYPIKRLVKAYTIKKVCGAIIWAEGNREHNQYIPSFNTPLELEQKWNTIVNQARKNKNLEPLEF